jgi:hypothetical protein
MLTKEWHNRQVLRLADKLCDDPDIIQASLCVGDSHYAVQPVDTECATVEAGVIPSILRPGVSMEIKINPESIFTSPSDGLENVCGPEYG